MKYCLLWGYDMNIKNTIKLLYVLLVVAIFFAKLSSVSSEIGTLIVLGIASVLLLLQYVYSLTSGEVHLKGIVITKTSNKKLYYTSSTSFLVGLIICVISMIYLWSHLPKK